MWFRKKKKQILFCLSESVLPGNNAGSVHMGWEVTKYAAQKYSENKCGCL